MMYSEEQEQAYYELGEELEELVFQCMQSTKVTGQILFSHLFYSEMSVLHDQIFDLIDDPARFKAAAAPRGLGKTTIARTKCKKAILFREKRFIVYVSNTVTLAEMQTENIKRELRTNPEVRRLFGDIKISDLEDFTDDSFSKKAWVAFGNTLILPRGAGQQIRGLNWNGYRPDLVIFDDLENKDELRSEDNREKIATWFYSDAIKIDDQYSKTCEFFYIDTIKHQAALIVDLMESPKWKTIQLSICDEEFQSYDPNYLTNEEIKEEVEEHRRAGRLDEFYMERMNIPISLADATFKDDYFQQCSDSLSAIKIAKEGMPKEIIPTRKLITVTLVDPAKTVKLQSKESGIVTVSIDLEGPKLFVRRARGEKFYPDELYDAIFEDVQFFQSRYLAVEVTSLHQFISQPIENEMRRRKIFPQYIEIDAKGKKEERVADLAPYYKLGLVYHVSGMCARLENQLRWFPRSKLWDVMDAFAHVVQLMQRLELYVIPEYEQDEPDPEDFSDLQDFDMDPVDSWRVL
jgi:hypothetical protein